MPTKPPPVIMSLPSKAIRDSVTVKIKAPPMLTTRLRVGGWIMRVGAWVAGVGLVVESGGDGYELRPDQR